MTIVDYLESPSVQDLVINAVSIELNTVQDLSPISWLNTDVEKWEWVKFCGISFSSSFQITLTKATGRKLWLTLFLYQGF